MFSLFRAPASPDTYSLLEVTVDRRPVPKGIQFFRLDEPGEKGLVPSESFRVWGWVVAAEDTQISALRIETEGRHLVKPIQCGYSRPDVAEHFGRPDWLTAGFCGLFHPKALFPGKVSITVELTNGETALLATITGAYRAGSAPADPFDVVMDTSQEGEVMQLRKYIQDGWPRCLVDVGAHDGTYLSNSQPFCRLGWQALLVEPMPKVYERLSSLYREIENVTCVNLACSDEAGPAIMFQGIDGELGQNSTLCIDQNDWFSAHRSSTQVRVGVDTLSGILFSHSFPLDFSLLLIDAEGMDYEVLKGLDLNVFTPRLILTEEYAPKNGPKYMLLSKHGYKLVERMGSNTLWLRQELVHK